MMNLEDICDFWYKSSKVVSNSFEEITSKYSFENLDKIRRTNSQTTHLEYWKDVGQFGLTPALEDHDIDMDYMHFVQDFYEHVTFRNKNEIADSELEDYFECIDRLFYSWIGFSWQQAKGYNTGLPTCTVENNSVIMFYLNDFLFDGLTHFHNIWDNNRINGRSFNRDLKPIEIFARTNQNFKWKDREIKWKLTSGDNELILTVKNNETKIQGNLETKLIHEPDAKYDNSSEVAAKHFISVCDKYIYEGWHLSEIKSR